MTFRFFLFLVTWAIVGCGEEQSKLLRSPSETPMLHGGVSGAAQVIAEKREEQASRVKIKFRLENIRPDGLRGPPDGLVAVSYEFCVPRNERVYAEIRRIDPSVQLHPGSRGRIGCGDGLSLCIGSTHQKGWREVLMELAARPDIAKIRECFFE